MKIYLKLILITLFCVQASVAEEVAPVFQVFIKELAEYETRKFRYLLEFTKRSLVAYYGLLRPN